MKNRLDIQGTFGGGYDIAELDGEQNRSVAASDEELTALLRQRGLTDSEILNAIKDLAVRRRIILAVDE